LSLQLKQLLLFLVLRGAILGVLQLGLGLVHCCHQLVQFLGHVSGEERISDSQTIKVNRIAFGQVCRDLVLLAGLVVLLLVQVNEADRRIYGCQQLILLGCPVFVGDIRRFLKAFNLGLGAIGVGQGLVKLCGLFVFLIWESLRQNTGEGQQRRQ